MMAFLTGPLSILCFLLTFLCFRRNFYKQAFVLGGFAIFFFVLTMIIAWAGYYTWSALGSGVV